MLIRHRPGKDSPVRTSPTMVRAAASKGRPISCKSATLKPPQKSDREIPMSSQCRTQMGVEDVSPPITAELCEKSIAPKETGQGIDRVEALEHESSA